VQQGGGGQYERFVVADGVGRHATSHEVVQLTEAVEVHVDEPRFAVLDDVGLGHQEPWPLTLVFRTASTRMDGVFTGAASSEVSAMPRSFHHSRHT
jgi:hypothetical protein